MLCVNRLRLINIIKRLNTIISISSQFMLYSQYWKQFHNHPILQNSLFIFSSKVSCLPHTHSDMEMMIHHTSSKYRDGKLKLYFFLLKIWNFCGALKIFKSTISICNKIKTTQKLGCLLTQNYCLEYEGWFLTGSLCDRSIVCLVICFGWLYSWQLLSLTDTADTQNAQFLSHTCILRDSRADMLHQRTQSCQQGYAYTIKACLK